MYRCQWAIKSNIWWYICFMCIWYRINFLIIILTTPTTYIILVKPTKWSSELAIFEMPSFREKLVVRNLQGSESSLIKTIPALSVTGRLAVPQVPSPPSSTIPTNYMAILMNVTVCLFTVPMNLKLLSPKFASSSTAFWQNTCLKLSKSHILPPPNKKSTLEISQSLELLPSENTNKKIT